LVTSRCGITAAKKFERPVCIAGRSAFVGYHRHRARPSFCGTSDPNWSISACSRLLHQMAAIVALIFFVPAACVRDNRASAGVLSLGRASSAAAQCGRAML
jgi:hypothetical protein